MSKRVAIVIPHSHTWFWTQTCIAKVREHTDLSQCDIVVVDNSWEWSPSIRGITDTSLGDNVKIVQNNKPDKYHATGLDTAFENLDHEFVITLETDSHPLHNAWMDKLLTAMPADGYAVGAWHFEQFVNPSCALYRREAWERMRQWCSRSCSDLAELRWGPEFSNVDRLTPSQAHSIGPFSERRGWDKGTTLRYPSPAQHRGPGWYEPGQFFYTWAVNNGYSAQVVSTHTTTSEPGVWPYSVTNVPTGTYYGVSRGDDLANAWAVHLWGGTRALDQFKHAALARIHHDEAYNNISDVVISHNMQRWLRREAGYWVWAVPPEIREQTLELIREHSWAIGELSEMEKYHIEVLKTYYREGGAPL